MTLRTGFSHSLHGAKAGPWLEGHPPSPSRDEGRQGKQGQQQLSGTTSRKGGSPQPFPRHLTPQQPGQHGKWGPCARGRVQMPEGRGECDAYRLTRSARAHPRPEGPQSQERSTHMWSSGGGWPHKCQIFFLQLFSLSLVFFFSISSDANFFFFLHVVVVVIILFLKTNHIWSCFSADTGTRGGDEADTNMRQAGRAPRAAGLQTPTLSGETRRSPHCSGATGAPEQWKCTFCHLPSRRCHTRVSSDWLVRGRPWPSMYCVRRM